MLQFMSSSQLCPCLKQSKLQQLFPTSQEKSGLAGVPQKGQAIRLSASQTNECGIGLEWEGGDQ